MKILVWNIYIRVFHISLILFTIASFISADDFKLFHEISGYIIFFLISFRLIYGCFTRNKLLHITSFFYSYKEIKQFVISVFEMKEKIYLGHNPLASLVMLLMFLIFILLFITGSLGYALKEELGFLSFFFDNNHYIGKILLSIHELLGDALLALIIMHLIGVLVSSFLTKENFVKSIFVDGMKRKEDKGR